MIIAILCSIAWIVFGWFAARMMYIDMQDAFALMGFLMGPAGWLASILIFGNFRQAHFLDNVNIDLPFIRFFKKKLSDRSLLSRFLAVKE